MKEDELKRAVRLGFKFYKDVTPQIGGIALQDYSYLVEFENLARKLEKEDNIKSPDLDQVS